VTLKAHVTIVLDVSASMNVDRRLEIAKNAMKTFVNSTMKPGDSFSIVTFDNSVTSVLGRRVKSQRVSFSMQMWVVTV
jgi:Mg-chelatase subunit ChlD